MRLSDVIVSISPVPASEEHVALTRATIAEMKAYMQQAIDERRRRPANDVIGRIVQAEADGKPLQGREIIALSFNLLAAGLETTGAVLAIAVRLLAERPDVFAQLHEDRTLLDRFIEELLRLRGAGGMPAADRHGRRGGLRHAHRARRVRLAAHRLRQPRRGAVHRS